MIIRSSYMPISFAISDHHPTSSWSCNDLSHCDLGCLFDLAWARMNFNLRFHYSMLRFQMSAIAILQFGHLSQKRVQEEKQVARNKQDWNAQQTMKVSSANWQLSAHGLADSASSLLWYGFQCQIIWSEFLV